MPDTTITVTPRVVPGAPPPPPVSKSQKKKRKGGAKTKDESEPISPVVKTDAVLSEEPPKENSLKEGIVAPQLAAQQSEGEIATPVGDHKATPIVDMLNKRLKANGKKITRIQIYQHEPPEKLNEDQKRLLKTLPILEAVSKELEEVKKAIEVHEAEVAQELAFVKAQAARAQEERIRDAVSATQADHLEKTADLVSFFRLLNGPNGPPQVSTLNENESSVIYSITENLFNEKPQSNIEIIRGIFNGEGDYLGVPYLRIREIQDLFLHPPPSQEKLVDVPPLFVTEETTVGGVLPSAGPSGEIRFILTDELAEAEAENETEPESNEWVQVAPTGTETTGVTESVLESNVNGHIIVEDTLAITATTEAPATSAQLSWADEDHEELPSLANLQAHYGTPSEASPAPELESAAPETPLNGVSPLVDEEGFTLPHRGRGRGRGYRGERSVHRGERGSARGERGAFRGERGGYRGFRGEHRGEHHGEYRGRGGHRGDYGERGGRGWRGGDRGFRGRPEGDWRGGRGGRGRGRGDQEAQGGPTVAA